MYGEHRCVARTAALSLCLASSSPFDLTPRLGLLRPLRGLLLFGSRFRRRRAFGRGRLLAGAGGVDGHLGVAGFAFIEVGLAVAAAYRPRHPHAEIRRLDAGAGGVGRAALAGRQLAIQRRIAGDLVGSAAGLVEICDRGGRSCSRKDRTSQEMSRRRSCRDAIAYAPSCGAPSRPPRLSCFAGVRRDRLPRRDPPASRYRRGCPVRPRRSCAGCAA